MVELNGWDKILACYLLFDVFRKEKLTLFEDS